MPLRHRFLIQGGRGTPFEQFGQFLDVLSLLRRWTKYIGQFSFKHHQLNHRMKLVTCSHQPFLLNHFSRLRKTTTNCSLTTGSPDCRIHRSPPLCIRKRIWSGHMPRFANSMAASLESSCHGLSVWRKEWAQPVSHPCVKYVTTLVMPMEWPKTSFRTGMTWLTRW